MEQDRRPGRSLIVPALGMAMGEDDVFHVYTTQPRTHFSGRPCQASVGIHADPRHRLGLASGVDLRCG